MFASDEESNPSKFLGFREPVSLILCANSLSSSMVSAKISYFHAKCRSRTSFTSCLVSSRILVSSISSWLSKSASSSLLSLSLEVLLEGLNRGMTYINIKDGDHEYVNMWACEGDLTLVHPSQFFTRGSNPVYSNARVIVLHPVSANSLDNSFR